MRLVAALRFAGYVYGCTVGWIWGGLLSRGRIERHGRLWVFRGLPSWAYPRGGVCVGHCFLTGDGPLDDRLLAHESVHERQWRRYGFLMPVLYALAGRDPLRNRFEIEAGLEDGNYLPRRRGAPVSGPGAGRSVPGRGCGRSPSRDAG